MRGYDSHFLIREIGKFKKRISIIPTNTEKFISFSISNVKFKDSYQFLGASLDKLTKHLVKKELTEKIIQAYLNIFRMNLTVNNSKC